MKVALLQEPLCVGVEEMPMPTVGPTDVLVKVAACGICGTDVEAYLGHQPRGWTITYPFRMGHELAGTVVEAGSQVPNVKTGDRVVCDGRLPCGYCHYCRRGMFSACQHAGYFSGGLAQYSRYPYQNLVRVPDNVSLEDAAMAEPLACVVNGQSKIDVPFGGVAVVIGDGAIGLMHMQMLKHRGAYTILGGITPHRLEMARQLGADVVVDVAHEDLAAAVQAASEGRGADVAINAVGKAAVIKQAIDLAARRGQVLFFAATMQASVELDLDLVHYKELALLGTYDSTIAQFEDALNLISKNIVQVAPLISHRLPLADAQRGYEIARNQEGIKVMIIHEGEERQ
ncbi:MAG TPA: alcohol dehydrogenase catalytic domain-containing protein [Anaerolineae bacterium]